MHYSYYFQHNTKLKSFRLTSRIPDVPEPDPQRLSSKAVHAPSEGMYVVNGNILLIE